MGVIIGDMSFWEAQDVLWAALGLDQWARRIESAKFIGDATWCLKTIQRADPAKGKALTAELHLTCLAGKILNSRQWVHAERLVQAVRVVDPVKANELMQSLHVRL